MLELLLRKLISSLNDMGDKILFGRFEMTIVYSAGTRKVSDLSWEATRFAP